MAESPERVNVIGVRVSALSIEKSLLLMQGWIERRDRRYVCVTGAHGIIESRSDSGLRAIHNLADLVTPDGMPVVWFCRISGHPETERVYGPDLMAATCDFGLTRGWRHFLYGGGPGVADRLAERLVRRWPALRIAGTFTPPFREVDSSEARDIAARIDATGADLVWVGLSTPKQEQWMARMRPILAAPVLLGVGAAFDFHAGLKPQAPRMLQKAGLEWAYRLSKEPRRLWRRYARVVPSFIALATLQKLGLLRFED